MSSVASRSSSTAPPRRAAALVAAMLTLTAGLTLGAAAPSQAASFTDPATGIAFDLDETNRTATATESRDVAYEADLVIPESVTFDGNSYRVTAIGDGAFSSFLNFTQLHSVVIPDSVTTIGNYAFQGTWMESAVIGNSVTSIGSHAFQSNQLTSIEIPSSVTTIGNGAFSQNQLTSIEIPSSVTAIAPDTFGTNRLTSVEIPGTVTSIGRCAFYDNSLTSVEIPSSVTSIEECAFYQNPSLTSVSFAGPAPAINPGNAQWPALGTAGGLTVHYLKQYETAGGFTYPTWQAYNTTTAQAVTFDSNGGSAIDPASVEVDRGSKVAKPADPTRTGYAFTGWYTDQAGNTPYGFDTKVDGDIVLYAGWSINSYTVTFDSNGGSAVPSVTADHGTTIPAPADPTRTGYTFSGWFTGGSNEQAFDFSKTITGDLTLYAMWQAVPVQPTPPTHRPGHEGENDGGHEDQKGEHEGDSLSDTGGDPSPILPIGGFALLLVGAALLAARYRRA